MLFAVVLGGLEAFCFVTAAVVGLLDANLFTLLLYC